MMDVLAALSRAGRSVERRVQSAEVKRGETQDTTPPWQR